MPNDMILAPAAEETAVRHDRSAVLAFISDAETEAALREGLIDAVPRGIEIRRGNLRAAIASLQKMPTPHTLIVDVSGESQPVAALDELSSVVEPDVRVLVVGERDDVNFYRQVTRGLGVVEYLYKPLVPDMVARHFGPQITRHAVAPELVHGGRVIAVTGVRGGVGASTIAANLAWHFGSEASRHTVLLDADLHRGDCAMLLGAKTGSGLRSALETPERVDELFVERSTQPVSDRLHVLAAEEKLVEQPVYATEGAARLLDALRRRYNFIVVDAPFSQIQMHRDLLTLAHQRVLVMEPTLACVRDALRLLALPNGPMQPRRAVLVLNRLNCPGGLSRAQVREALQLEPDVVIPDLPKLVGHAATLGQPAAATRGGFRKGMLALAREVAFVRLLSGSEAGSTPAAPMSGLRRLIGGRK